MPERIVLSVACDTDPDFNPPFRTADSASVDDSLWGGISEGIEILRQHLMSSSLSNDLRSLPITWLLRSDRQIHEMYGDPAYCLTKFERIWDSERALNSELGWHPHLYRWNDEIGEWLPFLGACDDLQILSECLAALRQHCEITAVRTGWDYHSNDLMNLFDASGLKVDASALPGCSQIGLWFYDWRSTGRDPYYPSKTDYRIPGNEDEESLSILEMPVLVRTLSHPFHQIRWVVRNLRGVWYQFDLRLLDWKSARWQGLMITGPRSAFRSAVEQTFQVFSGAPDIFLNTYFHTNELLIPEFLERLILNLGTIDRLSRERGIEVVPTTLTRSASMAQDVCFR